jgi:phage gpG-like protein
MGELLIREEQQQFATEGRHASGGWKPLKPATLASKRRRGLRMEILQATGDLMSSLTDRGDKNMIFDAKPTELVFGTSVPYAIFHQTGTRRMSRRRPIELTEQTRRECVRILQRYLIEARS